MLRSFTDTCSRGVQSPRGVLLVCLGLAALTGLLLLSSREREAEAMEGAAAQLSGAPSSAARVHPGGGGVEAEGGPEGAAVQPSAAALEAGRALMAQGVIGPNDIRLRKCPQLLPQIAEQWEHQKANPQSCRVLAEHYPVAGGAGCPCPCPKGRKMYGTAYRVEHHQGLWPEDFVEKMRRADGVMSRQGPVIKHQLNETVNTLHMALSYHCCITKKEAAKVADVIDAFPWEKHTLAVQFSTATCALSGPGPKTSLVLMADKESQPRLARVSEAFEDELAARGVHHIRHRDLQAFHITLGTLDGDLYPTWDALTAINSAVPPFSWAPHNFTVMRPACFGCIKAREKLALNKSRR